MPPIRDNPEVIAPPPILFAGMLAIGLAVDFRVVRLATHIPAYPRDGLAILLLAGACALAAAAIRGFRRAGTHVEPWEPSTAIVTTGVYRFTRNPMYLAGAIIYIAVALAADSGVTLLLLAPLLVILRYGVIAREERYLQAKFGDEYRRYQAAVRRWL
jgi:protein-S-isoprenylcysteine O-methyltransferase Ste14